MNYRSLTLLVLAALLPGAGLAQSETETKVIPRYDVEVVIFRNLQVPKSKEFILPISSPTKDEKILDLSSASSVAAASKLNYELVPGDSYKLVEVVNKLVESPRYELLLHTAWRQPGLDLEQALPVWIKGGRIYGNEYTSIDSQIEFLESLPKSDSPDQADGKSYEFDEQTLEALELQLMEQQGGQQHQGLYELEGKITISLSRYLHTYTDLVLRRPRLSVDSVISNPARDRYLAAHTADTRILNNHSLKEHRRMRSKNLHYLDNPEFSLLILITAYKAPEEAVVKTVETGQTGSE